MLSKLSVRSWAMSSRLLQRGCVTYRPASTAAATTTTTAATATDGERDLVNFPARKRPIEATPYRMKFVPEAWFDMLYPKTGVLGPYVICFGGILFLLSKELWVIEHQFYDGAALGIICVTAYKYFSPVVNAHFEREAVEEEKSMNSVRSDSINSLHEITADCEKAIIQGKDGMILYDVKKENIGLQLEAGYRERLRQVHRQVKKRLDYQMETGNVKSRFEQRHMVNWIVQSVRQSITPAQEAASLKQCVADLKGLALKA